MVVSSERRRIPSKLTHIVERIAWFSKVPVDYSFQGSSFLDSIPGSKIPVSDGHSRSPGQLGKMPFRIIWRLKVSDCIVISGQETRNLGKTLFPQASPPAMAAGQPRLE